MLAFMGNSLDGNVTGYNLILSYLVGGWFCDFLVSWVCVEVRSRLGVIPRSLARCPHTPPLNAPTYYIFIEKASLMFYTDIKPASPSDDKSRSHPAPSGALGCFF